MFLVHFYVTQKIHIVLIDELIFVRKNRYIYRSSCKFPMRPPPTLFRSRVPRQSVPRPGERIVDSGVGETRSLGLDRNTIGFYRDVKVLWGQFLVTLFISRTKVVLNNLYSGDVK